MSTLRFQRQPVIATPLRLLVCDVDRTLLTHDHALLPRVARAARALPGAGIELVLASARSPAGLERVHADLGAAQAVCCFNGAWVGDLRSRTPLRETRIARDLALEAMAFVHAAGGAPIWFDLESCHVLTEDEAVARRRTDVTGDALGLIRTPEDAPGAPFKLLATLAGDRIGRVVAELRERFAEHLLIVQSGPSLVELVSPEVRKDRAASVIAGRMGLDPAAVAAAGDSDNDIELLEWAGLAITVANAGPHIQALADVVAPSCDEGGMAEAMTWLAAERAAAQPEMKG